MSEHIGVIRAAAGWLRGDWCSQPTAKAVEAAAAELEDTDEDAYGMVYRVGSHEPATAGRV